MIYPRESAVSYLARQGQLTEGQADAALDALEGMIVEACKRGDEVHLACGKFEKAERDGVYGVVFRQATSVKEYLNT